MVNAGRTPALLRRKAFELTGMAGHLLRQRARQAGHGDEGRRVVDALHQRQIAQRGTVLQPFAQRGRGIRSGFWQRQGQQVAQGRQCGTLERGIVGNGRDGGHGALRNGRLLKV